MDFPHIYEVLTKINHISGHKKPSYILIAAIL